MKTVTLMAPEDLLEKGHDCARQHKTTLNAMFRKWLTELTEQREIEERLNKLNLRLHYVQAGRKFHREEMNEH